MGQGLQPDIASYGQSSVEIPPPPPPRLVEASGTAAEILKLVNQDSAAPARVDLESSPHDVSAKPGETDENKINSDNVGVKDKTTVSDNKPEEKYVRMDINAQPLIGAKRKGKACCECSAQSKCVKKGRCQCATKGIFCMDCESYGRKCENRTREVEVEDLIAVVEEEEKNETEEKKREKGLYETIDLSKEFLQKLVLAWKDQQAQIKKLRGLVAQQGKIIEKLQKKQKEVRTVEANNREELEAVKVRVEPQKLLAEIKKVVQETLGEKEKKAVRSEVPVGRGDSKEVARGVGGGGIRRRESQVAYGGSGRDGGEIGRGDERKKTIIIWGLDSQLNLEAAIQEVLVRTTVRGVEVEKWKRLATREGKLLVFVQLKEEKI